MRLLTLLTVSLLAATASADPAPPLPFEVIRALPSTNQVLVYDRAHNTHLLLSPGAKIDDYVVIEISGVGLTLEKQQERFTVYPRAAMGLVMELEHDKNSPPVIYSKTDPAAAPAQVAAAPAPQVAAPQSAASQVAARTTETKTRVATELASLLAVDTQSRSRGPSPSHAAKLKP